MSAPTLRRPADHETADYYHVYTGAVPDGNIIEILERQRDEAVALFKSLPADRWDFRYAPGKWTVKEIFGHILDTEWVFTYRALSIARGDQSPLPGIDQDEFAATSNAGDRDPVSMIREFEHLRTAGTALFESFDESTLDRTGVASGCEFTVRGLVYIVAGHELHHMRVIKERYL